MTFKKPIPENSDKITEEEQDAIDEWDAELEAFEHHELPVFFELIELHTDLTPDEVLEALNGAFYYGLRKPNTGGFDIGFRGLLPVESAHKLYGWIEENRIDYQKLGDYLIRTLHYTRTKYEIIEEDE